MSSADISFFSPEISKYCNIKKYRYRLYFDTYFQILLTFFESLKIVLMKMVTILIMSDKLATKVPLKIKFFWNIGYAVIISIYNATNKILSLDSNYIVDVVTWPKFGISMKEVIISSFWFKFNDLRLTQGMALNVHTSAAKGLKLKVRRFSKLILTFIKVKGKKLVGRGGGLGFLDSPPSWIVVKCWYHEFLLLFKLENTVGGY